MSSTPEGTKPWRKGWRKRWAEGSSFRGLSPVAKVLVHWVEENCDDEGRVTTTMRYLASMVSGTHHRHKVSRMTIWRALQEGVNAGLLISLAGQQTLQAPTRITRVKFKDYQDTQDGSDTAMRKVAGRSSRGSRGGREKIPSGGSPAATATTFAALAHWGFSLDAKTRTVVARRVKEGMPPDEVLARCVVARAERFASGRVIDNPMVAVGSGMDGFFKTREREVSSVRREFGEWAARVRAGGSGVDGAGAAETLPEDHPRLSLVGGDGQAQHPQVSHPGRSAGHVQNYPGLDLGRLDGDLGASCTVDLPGDVPWPNEFYGLVTTQQH